MTNQVLPGLLVEGSRRHASRALTKLRSMVGEVGYRVLLALALPIHAATVVVAFTWYDGWASFLSAFLSTVIPILPEAYWTVRIYLAEGTMVNWYVLTVACYPAVWLLFILGGVVFMPESDPEQS